MIKATESNEELKKRVQTLFDKAVSKKMFIPKKEIKAFLLRLDDRRQVANSNNQMFKQNRNQPKQSFNKKPLYKNLTIYSKNQEENNLILDY